LRYEVHFLCNLIQFFSLYCYFKEYTNWIKKMLEEFHLNNQGYLFYFISSNNKQWLMTCLFCFTTYDFWFLVYLFYNDLWLCLFYFTSSSLNGLLSSTRRFLSLIKYLINLFFYSIFIRSTTSSIPTIIWTKCFCFKKSKWNISIKSDNKSYPA